jgi:phage terminase large subunit-like protein
MIPDEYIRTKADQYAIDIEGWTFEIDRGLAVKEFFSNHLTLPSGKYAGKPFHLMDWQAERIVIPLFSWGKYIAGKWQRRFSRCLVSMGKKQGKSVLCAGLSLALLLLFDIESPRIVLGGSTEKQAGDLFQVIQYFTDHSPRLRKALSLAPSEGIARYPKRHGEIIRVSSEAPGLAGKDCSGIVLDEISQHYNSNLYEILKSSTVARDGEGLHVYVSNSGFDKSHYYHEELYKPAKAIEQGTSLDTSMLPCIWEVPEECNWKDSKHWVKANPSLGTVMTLDSFRNDFEDALRNKAGEIHFRRFRLNQWVSKRNAWIDLDEWDKCKGEFPVITSQNPVYIGCDLAATVDLCSVVACYPIDDKFYFKSFNFVPMVTAKKREKINDKSYQQFALDGSLTLTSGNTVNYSEIRDCISKIPGKCVTIALDMKFANETAQLLMKAGYDCLDFPQWPRYYNEPTRKFETLIKDRLLVHDGNTCLRWCVNNAELVLDSKGLAKPMKSSENSPNHVDAVQAAVMALSQAMLHNSKPVQWTRSVYEDRGIIWV